MVAGFGLNKILKHANKMDVPRKVSGAGSNWKNPDGTIKGPPNNGAVPGKEEIVIGDILEGLVKIQADIKR